MQRLGGRLRWQASSYTGHREAFGWRTLANFSHGMPNMHRMALCLALALSLGGCTDYKWGHSWRVDQPGGWTDSPTPYGDESAILEASCGPNPLSVSVRRNHSGLIFAIFFIPFFPQNGSDDRVRISVSHPDLKACTSLTQSPLVLKMDNRVVRDISWSPGYGNHQCDLTLPEGTQGEQLSIEVNQAVFPCSVAPATLKKSRYFCLRQTTFGGSPRCDD